MEAGRPAAGSSRTGAHRANTTARPRRLDPFSLPARFTTAETAADEGLCIVNLHRERVVLRRALSGMRMAVNLPVAAYRGVAIRLDATAETPPFLAVTLEHANAGLSLPLFASTHNDDVLAEWQIWGRVLGLPLLIAETDGTLREAFAHWALADRRANLAPATAQCDRAPTSLAVVVSANGKGRRQHRLSIAANARSARRNRFGSD